MKLRLYRCSWLYNPLQKDELAAVTAELRAFVDPGRREVTAAVRKALRITINENNAESKELVKWLNQKYP
jgi:hypothetical protein